MKVTESQKSAKHPVPSLNALAMDPSKPLVQFVKQYALAHAFEERKVLDKNQKEKLRAFRKIFNKIRGNEMRTQEHSNEILDNSKIIASLFTTTTQSVENNTAGEDKTMLSPIKIGNK